MRSLDIDRWKPILIPHGLLYSFLTLVIICLLILTVVYASLWNNNTNSPSIPLTSYAVANGIIGFPPLLPNDGPYVQWTFLQMNDVYELLPLDQGQRGGLSRVAYLRQLLLKENNDTITILAGDLVSPSALGLVKINGTALHGKQMVATMNTLGLDYMVFGNHEFDLSAADLLTRMNESTFTWISSNVFLLNSNQSFGSSITHKLITIGSVRILIIGYTINETGNYIRFINPSSLVTYTQEFLTMFPNGTYDVLVALTHLDVATDMALAVNIPQIDLIIGGHEHVNQFYTRGATNIPINKADANTATVYIHRCAFNLNTKRLRIYSTLAQVSPEVPDEEKTAAVANYWFNLCMAGFQALGYQPSQTVSCLPEGVELDGRSEAIETSQTSLTDATCNSMVYATSASGTTIGVFNSGTIRIDDILPSTITEYDILRTLPYGDNIIVLSVPGQILAQVLTTSLSFKGTGIFLSYCRVQTLDGGSTWSVDGSNIATNGINYTIATLDFARQNTGLNNGNVTFIQQYNVTETQALINYLRIIYPPC
jgi:5'-nucleotidase/UDP-sugar diphosphatase